MTVALSMGLYISHCFIPPTPGPIAAANLLGIGNEMLLVIGLGMLLSIPPLIAGYIFARYIGKRVKSKDELAEASGEPVKTYEELLKEYGQLPGAVMSFAPIVVRFSSWASPRPSRWLRWTFPSSPSSARLS